MSSAGNNLSSLLNTAKIHQECCVQCWAPQYRRDLGILEQAKPTVMKMTEEPEHLLYEERLREVGVFYLEKSRLRRAYPCVQIPTWRAQR